VTAPALASLALGTDTAAALAGLPAVAGVGQILGASGRSLLIGRPGNLRRWAASHLGLLASRGKRPRTDLRPVAEAVAWVGTESPFQQRLVYERLMAEHVPLSRRRDLRSPAYLHLDTGQRFPRVVVRDGGARDGLFGPFRDRRAAEAAARVLHKRFPLRPCDAAFEPDPALPLGLGCLYAQVHACSAPCLGRVGEAEYRALARAAGDFLAQGDGRGQGEAAWLPSWVGPARGLGLVVEIARRVVELYPVRDGGVLEAAAVRAPVQGVPDAVRQLVWPEPPRERDDRPWLLAWLHARRKSGVYLGVAEPVDLESLAARVVAALADSFRTLLGP
jgi:hypothetical protein